MYQIWILSFALAWNIYRTFSKLFIYQSIISKISYDNIGSQFKKKISINAVRILILSINALLIITLRKISF